MKKWISLLTALVMLFALAACSASNGGAEENAASSEAPAAPTEAGQNDASAEAAANEAAEPAPATAYPDLAGKTLMIYCGAGMTKPFTEIAAAFEQETGCAMEVTYANAGQIQSQINTAQEGDLFIAGSADEVKPVSDYVTASVNLVKHIPVLAVAAGNPKNLAGLNDLTNEGVVVALGDGDAMPLGKIANKALTELGILDKINVVARFATAPAIANALIMGECDAVILWKENAGDPSIEIVNTADLDPYIKTVPAASLSFPGGRQRTQRVTYLPEQRYGEKYLDQLRIRDHELIWASRSICFRSPPSCSRFWSPVFSRSPS